MMRTLYEMLEVPQDASYQEIRDAYHCRSIAHCRACLDRLQESEKEAAAKELRWINRAWEILQSPEARKRYDRQLINMVLRQAGRSNEAIPSYILTQTREAPHFCCAFCGYETEEHPLTRCPACEIPAKAVWTPRSRILRQAGLAPFLARVANASARQYRNFVSKLASVHRLFFSKTALVIIFVLAVLLALSFWMYDVREKEQREAVRSGEYHEFRK